MIAYAHRSKGLEFSRPAMERELKSHVKDALLHSLVPAITYFFLCTSVVLTLLDFSTHLGEQYQYFPRTIGYYLGFDVDTIFIYMLIQSLIVFPWVGLSLYWVFRKKHVSGFIAALMAFLATMSNSIILAVTQYH